MFPAFFFSKMIISTGSKGAFVLCQLSRHNYHLQNVSLLFVAGFVIFDSLPGPLLHLPHWFQCHTFGMCAKYFHQRLSARGSDIRGTCSRAVINRGRDTPEYRFPPEMSGDPLGKEAWQITASAIWDILRMCLWDKRFSWLRKNRNRNQKEPRNCSSVLATY